MNLSIILAYRNREKSLLSLLTQVKRNLMFFKHNLEVIIVDLGSKENLQSRLVIFPFVRYFYLDYQGTFSKAWALNLGYRQAKHDWLFILDVDCIFFEKFLVNISQSINEFETNRFYLFEGIRDLDVRLTGSIHENHIITSKIKNTIEDEYNRLKNLGGVGNILLHRSWYEKLTGFDEKMMGWGREDSDFYHRLGATGAKETIIPASPDQSLFHMYHSRGDVTYNNLLIFYQNDFVELFNQQFNITRPNQEGEWGMETFPPDQYRYESLLDFKVEKTGTGFPFLRVNSLAMDNPTHPPDWEKDFEPFDQTTLNTMPVIILGGGLNYALKALLEKTKQVWVIEHFATIRDLACQWNHLDKSCFIDTDFQRLTDLLVQLKSLEKKIILVHKRSLALAPQWYTEVKKFIASPWI